MRVGAGRVRAGRHMGRCLVRHSSPDESISSHTSAHTVPTLPPLEANLSLYLHVVEVKAREVGVRLGFNSVSPRPR